MRRTNRYLLIGALSALSLAGLSMWPVVSTWSAAGEKSADAVTDNSFTKKIVDLFVEEVEDCAGLSSWAKDNPDALMAAASSDELEFHLRNLTALSAICRECGQDAVFTDPHFVQRVGQRRATTQFVLQARHHGSSRSDEVTAILDSLRSPLGTGYWQLINGADTFPCVFTAPEPSAGIVPGLDMLVAFDVQETGRGCEVHLVVPGSPANRLRFVFSDELLRKLDRQLSPTVQRTSIHANE